MLYRLFLLIGLTTLISNYTAQDLYIKTFGDKQSPPVLFLHGGPGYNAANFEGTTAKALAKKGFFVVVYDRRGEGRSIDSTALFNFRQTIEDIHFIIDSYALKEVTFIGHSFGGVVGTKYLQQYPDKVKQLVLVGAPISFQETFQTIIESSEKIFKEKEDASSLNYLKALQKMDKTSIQYSGYCFMYAMRNGFYTAKKPTKEATSIYHNFQKDSLLFPLTMQMKQPPVMGFWKNENYTSVDLSKDIEQIVIEGKDIKGIYGLEDGLFSKKQLKHHAKLMGSDNLILLENCSHNVFIDQQEKFIQHLVNWCQ